MKRNIKPKLFMRALVTITAITAAVSGITYAALQSQQAVLKGNIIQTAVANLQLSSDGTTYSNSLTGYSFGGLVPGGSPAPSSGYPIYLKNAGSTPLALKLSVARVTNNDNVDLTKVHIILSPFGGGAPQNITLAELVSSASAGGVALTNASHVLASQVTGYNLQVSMESDAVNSPSASLSDIDFSFGAAAVN